LAISNEKIVVNKELEGSVEIVVGYEAVPDAEFQWFDGSRREIAGGSEYEVDVSETEVKLTIKNVGYKHFGNFTLQAKNDAVVKEISIEVVVEGEKRKETSRI
jgi:hypothetical protein